RGERRRREPAHFSLEYWAWDEPLVDRIAGIVERAYERVTAKLHKEPDVVEQGKKVTAKLAPVYAVNPGLFKENVLASYPSGTKSMIFLRSPESYGGTVAGYTGEDGMLITVAHEFTHLMMDNYAFGPRLASWLNEGMAEYVSEGLQERTGTLVRAKRAGRLVNFDRLYEVLARQDAGGFDDSDILLAYAEGGRAMQYLDERFGLDSIIAWFDDYAKTRDMARSARNVFGVDWNDLQNGFLGWLNGQIPG